MSGFPEHRGRVIVRQRDEGVCVSGCAVEGCGRPHYGKGYCRKHWERNHRHGDPLVRRTLMGASAAERLAAHSRAEGDCVVWTRRRNAGGYGQIQVDGRAKSAHRVAYELAFGPIPEGLVVRHKCDNPPCIRLDHLELGTTADNNRDKAERGRAPRGEVAPQAKLNLESARRIRELRSTGLSVAVLAALFGVSSTTVRRVLDGVSWQG